MTTIRDNVRGMSDVALANAIKIHERDIPIARALLAHMRRELKRRKRANRKTP